MGQPVRVQVPPTTIKKGITCVIPFLICLKGEGFNPQIAGSADFVRHAAGVSPQCLCEQGLWNVEFLE